MNITEMKDGIQKLSLDELLSQLEIDLSRVGHNTQAAAIQMLLKMDQVFSTLAEMDQKRNVVKAETAQFEYIVTSLEKNARHFLKDVGGQEQLNSMRSQAATSPQQGWWYLDAAYQRQTRASFKRAAITLGGMIVGLVLLVFIYNRFFAPDPIVAKRYSLQLDADQYLAQGDYEKALASVSQALEIVPQDGGLVILRAVIYDRLGKKVESAGEMSRAEGLVNSRELYLLERTEAWIKVGAMAEATLDAQTCVQEFPESAQGYYYYGRINELSQKYNQAIDAYNRASELAAAQGKVELNATIRMTMAMLMQSMPAVQPTPLGTPAK